MDVEPGEAADDAGLAQGDVIVSVNGQAVDEPGRVRARDRGGAKRTGGPACACCNGQTYRVVVLKLK